MMDILKRLFCLIGLRHGVYVCMFVCMYLRHWQKTREETKHGAGAGRVRVSLMGEGGGARKVFGWRKRRRDGWTEEAGRETPTWVV